MGWASGVYIFDAAVDVTLNILGGRKEDGTFDVPDVLIQAVVEHMYIDLPLEDWDTQDESKYYEYIIPVMFAKGEIDLNTYEWHQAGCPDDWSW